MADSTSLTKLKALYNALVRQDGITYVVLSKQSIIALDRAFPRSFIYGYGDLPEQNLDPAALNTIQMNREALACSDIRLKEGRLFEEEDYRFASEIPLLAGSSYTGELAVGDSFQGEYLGLTFTFRIVGLLEQGSQYPAYDYVSLDHALVMPALECAAPLSNTETRFQQKLYLNHTNGRIFTSKSIFYVQSEIDRLCRSEDIVPYILVGMPNFKIGALGFASSFILLFIMSIVVFFLSALFLIFTLHKKVETLCRKQGMYMHGKGLYGGLYLEVFLWLLPVTTITFIGFSLLFPQTEVLAAVVISAVSLLITVPLPVIFQLHKKKGAVYNGQESSKA